MFKEGQKVTREPGGPIMEIIGFEPELVENVITQWIDDEGSVVTAKFIEAELHPVAQS